VPSIWLGQSPAWSAFVSRIMAGLAMREPGVGCDCSEQARTWLRAGNFDVLVVEWIVRENEPPERLIASIRESFCSIGVIAVSSNWRLGECIAALDSGGDDYVSADIDPREFSARLRAAARRRGVMGAEAQNLDVRATRLARDYGLSPREREILVLVASGVHLKQIGDALGCNYSTVRTHVRRLCAKLGCSGTREAIVKFFSSGEPHRS
jgi:DNA-binding NarL/FixJ family response regulator